ncbi:MAG TPA: nuclear transport factor 2 family protein [Solirubrobacterales bacterium]
MNTTTEATLEVRVGELADRLAITDVLYQYATALDSRDWDLLRSCFTADGVADFLEFGGVNEGRDAIVELCGGVLSGLDSSQHLIGNPRVRLEGDRAMSVCYFQAQHFLASPAGGNTYLVGGRYEDRHRRTEEGWQIAHRTLRCSWQDGNAGVFTEAAARLAAGGA